MSLGERIKALRRRAGLSQEQVAEQVGVSRQAVAKWEAGQSAPSTENLRKLAQVLQVGLEELAGKPAAACGPDQTGLGRSIRTCLQSALSVAGAYLLLFILGITAWEFRTLPDWMLEWRFVFGVLVNVPFQVPVPVYGWCAGLAVLLALLISAWTDLDLDGWMGMAVALFILYSGIGLIKDTLDPLLGRAPSEELTRRVEEKILSYEGILGTHDLMVHDYGPGQCFASVHVEMSAEMNVMRSHDIIDTIERDFHEQDHIHLVIHYDPIEIGSDAVGTMRQWVTERVHAVSPLLSIHDFRMVKGELHTNLIFDVAAPSSYESTDAEIKQQIQRSVQENANGETYYCVITVDRSYAPYHQD